MNSCLIMVNSVAEHLTREEESKDNFTASKLMLDHDDQSPTHDGTRRFSPIEEAMERLNMRHTTRPHSCEYCQQVVLDFRLSPLKLISPRPFEGIQVWCAKNTAEVKIAIEKSCPLYKYLFNGSTQLDDPKLQDKDVFLKIGGYSLGEYALDRFDQLTWTHSMHKHRQGSMEAKRQQYFIYHENTHISKDQEAPMLRLCGDANFSVSHLLETLGGPLFVPDVADETSIAWAKEQLTICDAQDSACGFLDYHGKQAQTFMPTRLIDVMGHPDRVRLVSSRSEFTGPNLRWCCLSYVWGGNQKLKTMKSNIAAHKKYIPMADLPATVRDAVVVSQKLGIRYLWVDSLCIIQDDEMDTKRELAVMGDVYRLAYVTIIAACASGVTQGFLHNRGYFFSDDSPPPVQLQCLDQTGEQTSVLAFPHTTGPESAADYHSPTEERAWTFQERRLSARNLYFGLRGLTFFCRVADIPNGTSRQAKKVATEILKHDLSAFSTSDWFELVQDYSSRQLSFPHEDKLNAISAVAKREAYGRHYLAGLWKQEFPVGLDWYVDLGTSGANQCAKPQQYRAPSWSWAAVDSTVRFWSRGKTRSSGSVELIPRHTAHEYQTTWIRRMKGAAKIKAATTTLVYPELQYGPVKEASIIVEADMAAVRWVDHGTGSWEVVSHNGSYFPAYPDTTDHMPSSTDVIDNSLQALLVFGCDSAQWCGLVLQQVDETSYRRVAFFCCCRKDWHDTKAAKKGCAQKFREFKKATVRII